MESGEHQKIADPLVLRFPGGDRPAASTQLSVRSPAGPPTGPVQYMATYGQLIALGGDFFGCPGETPISDGAGKTQWGPESAFQNAYLTLATDAPEEVTKITELITDEVTQLAGATGPTGASDVYKKLGDEYSMEWNVITGGGRTRMAGPAPFLPATFAVFALLWQVDLPIPQGRYLRLAAHNLDHFGDDALAAYTAGHQTARRWAAKLNAAGKAIPDVVEAMLEGALAMNAFADHFLTDLFSAGHLRTPRRGLYDVVGASAGPIPLPSFSSFPMGTWISGLLSRYMHDEDCAQGLAVTNKEGERWHAYGDKRLFDDVSTDNLRLVRKAVQTSIDEVYEAFQTGNPNLPMKALAVIPDLAAVRDASTKANPSPLFVQAGSQVHCRTDLASTSTYDWTNLWFGVSTLAELWSLGKYRSFFPSS